LKSHGLPDTSVTFEDAALLRIIRQYTEEAGVRSLVRQIARICRKVAKTIVTNAYSSAASDGTNGIPAPSINGHSADNSWNVSISKNGILNIDEGDEGSVKDEKENNVEEAPREPLPVPEGFHVTITAKSLDEYLGVPKYLISKSELGPKIGAVMGLAWTSTGGDVLPVEAVLVDGSERLTLTGQLGDVMKESAQAALTFIRARHKELKIPKDFTKRKEIHVHLPEGAIPKDGPSAGITLIMAIISAATGKPVRGDLAMTGEITLRGNVLAIGGLQEKLLSAKRAGIKAVIIPEDNRPGLSEIPERIREGLNIISVKTVDQAIPVVFDLTTPADKLKRKEFVERKEVAKPVRANEKKKAKKRKRAV